jgi:hypothetical protein
MLTACWLVSACYWSPDRARSGRPRIARLKVAAYPGSTDAPPFDLRLTAPWRRPRRNSNRVR